MKTVYYVVFFSLQSEIPSVEQVCSMIINACKNGVELINNVEKTMSLTEPTVSELSATYNNGCDAFHANIPLSSNPHKVGLCDARLQYSWHNGWVDSAKEDGHKWNVSNNKAEQKWSVQARA